MIIVNLNKMLIIKNEDIKSVINLIFLITQRIIIKFQSEMINKMLISHDEHFKILIQ